MLIISAQTVGRTIPKGFPQVARAAVPRTPFPTHVVRHLSAGVQQTLRPPLSCRIHQSFFYKQTEVSASALQRVTVTEALTRSSKWHPDDMTVVIDEESCLFEGCLELGTVTVMKTWGLMSVVGNADWMTVVSASHRRCVWDTKSRTWVQRQRGLGQSRRKLMIYPLHQ